MQFEPYVYRALVVDVHDGDTIRVNVDLGMGVTMTRQVVRLRGVSAPELREARGKEAGDYLRKLVYAQWILVRTHKDGREKYGRWLGDVFIGDVNVNEAMNQWIGGA